MTYAEIDADVLGVLYEKPPLSHHYRLCVRVES